MKISALADRKIDQDLKKLIKDESIELVLLLGDLKYIDICDLEEVKVPIIGILGNHCSFDYISKLKGYNLHNKKLSILGESFFGYQGCPYYKGGEFESSQEECLEKIENLTGCFSILISHSPAKGINSTIESPHEGFEGLTLFLEKFKPKFFFHGHSYPDKPQKISIYDKTIVYFVEGLEIIETQSLLNKTYPKSTMY